MPKKNPIEAMIESKKCPTYNKCIAYGIPTIGGYDKRPVIDVEFPLYGAHDKNQPCFSAADIATYIATKVAQKMNSRICEDQIYITFNVGGRALHVKTSWDAEREIMTEVEVSKDHACHIKTNYNYVKKSTIINIGDIVGAGGRIDIIMTLCPNTLEVPPELSAINVLYLAEDFKKFIAKKR